MAVVVGILVVVVGILVSVGLHELGHMVPAKKFGVRVTQYMVGFGPTLWSRVKGETEYGLKAIPLGGYVRLVGMYPPAPEGSPPAKGFWSQITAETREASTEEIRPGEEDRAFYNLSTPKKLTVMFGGPFMNLVIAFVLFLIVFVGIGTAVPTTTVSAVTPCVTSTSATTQAAKCTSSDPASPAEASGLKSGDTITSFNGTKVTSWDQLVDLINDAAGKTVPVVVDRDGASVDLSITPAAVPRQKTDANGNAVVDSKGDPETVPGGYIGVSATTTRDHANFTQAVDLMGESLAGTAKVVVTLPVQVIGVADSMFTGTPRDANSPQSLWGVGRMATDVASSDTSFSTQMSMYLMLLASLNIALFVFNMVPLLPLDGGHLANALYEGAKRQIARLRGLPRPRPADLARMMPVGYVVFVALIGVTALLIVADIVDPVTLG